MEAGLREKMHVDSLLKKKSFIHLCFLARDTVNEGDPEHRTWVSAARWVEATINQTMMSAAGGFVGDETRQGGTCVGGVLPVVWRVE